MTQLTKKLEAIQCDCDNLEGKTIVKAVRERGTYYLLFDDGSWCHTDYQLHVSDLLELRNDSFIALGLTKKEETDQHWREENARWESEQLERRRKQYENLKEEFE